MNFDTNETSLCALRSKTKGKDIQTRITLTNKPYPKYFQKIKDKTNFELI